MESPFQPFLAHPGRILVLVATLFSASTAHSNPSAENLATELAKLRAEVDSLASRIELEKRKPETRYEASLLKKANWRGMNVEMLSG